MLDPRVDTHVLLSRLPCYPSLSQTNDFHNPELTNNFVTYWIIKSSLEKVRDTFDLHVLGMPPALILSQDQTLI